MPLVQLVRMCKPW